MRLLLSTLILGSISCQVAASPTPQELLEVNGQPIHPACLQELLGWISDAQPVIAAVDVEGSAQSNRYSGGRISRIPGGWEYRSGEEAESGGFFNYWPLGTTPQGTHVVLTAWNGGGSGIFYTVLFLRLAPRIYFDQDEEQRRWILSALGEVHLGDRTQDEATLEQGMLVIRSPEGRERRIPVP